MVFGTSSAVMLDRLEFANTHSALLRQLAFAGMGIALAYLVMRMGYHSFLQNSPHLLALVTLFLALCYCPGFKRPYNGAYRWLGLGPFSFQPSELAKLIIPAYLIHRLRGAGAAAEEHIRHGLIWACRAILPAVFLVWIAPDNRTMLLIVGLCAVAFTLMLIPLRLWFVPLCALFLLGGVVALQLPYVKNRLRAYREPERELRGRALQPHQAKIAAGSGGLFGVGLGRSLQKFRYLPEAQNDYIAAIYGEELGFLGVCALIVCYAALTLGCWLLSLRCCHPRGRELGCCLTFSLGFQGFTNLGVVSGLLPATGLNLPFFSQGGTSLCANFAAIGLILSLGEARGIVKTRPTR